MVSNMSKSKVLALTLFLTVAILLASTPVAASGVVQLTSHDIHRRDHGQLNRMIRKRGAAADAVNAVAPDPDADANPTPTSTGTTSTGTSTTSTDTQTSTGSATSTSSTGSPSTTSTATDSGTSTSGSGTSTSASSTSSGSASSTGSSSSTTSKSTTSAPAEPTVAPVAPAGGSTFHSIARVTVTSPAVLPTDTPANNDANSGSLSKAGKTTLTVLIAVAGSIGAVALIWTIIRKWKFRPSSDFEDRMQPIDWQPTEADDGLPAHRRAKSNASSFHSGAGHSEENMAGRGMGGYGATSDSGHANTLAPIPDHDFTAGATLAPVGGYADLARGPSPQPQMQEYYGAPIHQGAGYANQDAYGTHDAYAAHDAYTGHEAYDYNGTTNPRY